jgi:hypothetical protein
MPLSTISQLYRGGQIYWWRRPEYPEKTTDLPQEQHRLLLRLTPKIQTTTNTDVYLDPVLEYAHKIADEIGIKD